MQVENNFQDLQIFESAMLNEYCDEIVNNIKSITGEDTFLVGSVAKVLSGHLPEDYKIKDIDFVVSEISFRRLLQHRKTFFPKAKTVELRPERMIVHLEKFCIEIWNLWKTNTDKEPKLYKNKINYLCQLELK